MPHILVTGGAGYIGSHTARLLQSRGYRITILDNLSTGSRSNIPSGCAFVQADVRDAEALAEVIRQEPVQGVFHFAASTKVDESVRNPSLYYENCFIASVRLFERCRELGVRDFIFSSTAAVYGEGTGKPASESDPLRPVNPYGRSKLMTEWYLEDLARQGLLRYVALRYFNVAGASPDGLLGPSDLSAAHLVKRAAEAACGHRPGVEVFGNDYPTPDGTGIRDYIHVEDIALAHLRAWEYLERGGRSCALNCGYGEGRSVLEVLSAMKRVTGATFDVQVQPRRSGDVASLVASPANIHAVLDWQPQFRDLDRICASAFAWEKSRGKAPVETPSEGAPCEL